MVPRLVIESGENSGAHTLQRDQTTSLGRNRTNSIVIRDKHASRWHAEILWEDGQWILRDCDTMNGTRVNNQLVNQPVPLKDGDEIRIGDTRLRFLLNGTAPNLPTQPMPAATLPIRLFIITQSV